MKTKYEKYEVGLTIILMVDYMKCAKKNGLQVQLTTVSSELTGDDMKFKVWFFPFEMVRGRR